MRKKALIAMGSIHTAYDKIKQQFQKVYRGGATRELTCPHMQFMTTSKLPGESLRVVRFHLQKLARQVFAQEDIEKMVIFKF